MAVIRINGHEVNAAIGVRLIDVLRGEGIHVPALCHSAEDGHFTSCMLCVVKEAVSGKLLPSCSALTVAGMVIETDSDEVHEARRAALELLLSEHAGDCEGPCRTACPASMNIPLMIRQIGAGDNAPAIRTIKEYIALPAVLGRICPAPCEKVCRRAGHDAAVAICLLKRFAADADLASSAPFVPECAPSTGKRVAVAGAGPAGLSAVYYLSRLGHACTLFDAAAAAGGALRTAVGRDRLPAAILDAEIDAVMSLGGVLQLNTRLGQDVSLAELRHGYDAVVLAVGPAADAGTIDGVARGTHGIETDHATMASSAEGVFAAGAAVRPMHMAVRACAEGRSAAGAVDVYLGGADRMTVHHRFNSRIVHSTIEEMDVLAAGGSDAPRTAGRESGWQAGEAVQEAGRCFGCDCRKADACLLRTYAEQYKARFTHYHGTRSPVEQNIGSNGVIFERGKCIKCGLCVRITRRVNEQLGLAFRGRGFGTVVTVPFDAPLSEALRLSAGQCVAACPTGALAFTHRKDQA